MTENDNVSGNVETEAGSSLASQSALGSGTTKDHFGSIVTARGTAEGLILRLDGRVDVDSLKQALIEFLAVRKSFLSGNRVILEWISKEQQSSVIEDIKALLKADYNITISHSRLKQKQSLASEVQVKTENMENENHSNSSVVGESSDSGLFGGMKGVDISEDEFSSFDDSDAVDFSTPVSMPAQFDNLLWDEPDARLVCQTLRSGQKVESDHTLIIVGDVNSGAEIIAGGDIIVLGNLRGVAHAGAYDETGGGRFIFALNLQPTQLRIGMVISRGSEKSGKTPEVAKVDGNFIVVEPYQPKVAGSRQRIR